MGRARRFVGNVLLLTGTSLLMRLIGLGFQIYLTRQIGAEGVGLYQLIMSVELFASTLAVCGMRLASMRLVTLEIAAGGPSRGKRAVRYCLCYSLSFGSMAGALLFTTAPFIAGKLLQSPDASLSLRILALSLPALGVSATLGGYFTAIHKIDRSVVAQFAEQFCRIGCTVGLLSLLLPKTPRMACAAVASGAVISEIFSCLIQLCFCRRIVRSIPLPHSGPRLHGQLLGLALPIAASALLRSGLSSVESILTPIGLGQSGMSYPDALSVYGMVRGMAMPVLFFPVALLTSLGELLVPEITECQAGRRIKQLHYILSRAFQLTVPFSIGVAGILYVYAEPLGLLLYQNPQAADFIRLLAPLVPVMYVDTVGDGMLKGLGAQVASMNYNILDAFIGICFVLIFLPRYGVAAYIASIYVTETINFLLTMNKVIAMTDFHFRWGAWVFKPAFSILGALSAAALLGRRIFPGGVVSSVQLFILICAVLFVYLLALVLFACVTREDLRWMAGLARSDRAKKQKGGYQRRLSAY